MGKITVRLDIYLRIAVTTLFAVCPVLAILPLATSLAAETSGDITRKLKESMAPAQGSVVAGYLFDPFLPLSGCGPPIVKSRSRNSAIRSKLHPTASRGQDRLSRIALRGHYAMLTQSAQAGETDVAGILRIAGQWQPYLGQNLVSLGSLNATVDYRRSLSNRAGLPNIGKRAGYLGATGLFFNDAGLVVLDLNWQQRFNDGRSAIVVGRFDPNDYLNMLGYAHPWSSFSNAAVLFDASLAIPDSSWGIAGMHFFNDQWYALGILNDVNGSQTDELQFFSGGPQYFALAEFGRSPNRAERCTKNWNISVWHADKRENTGQGASYGALFSASWMLKENWMPFLRVGVSSGDAPLYDESLTVGLVRHESASGSLLGLGVNWGRPSDKASLIQKTAEVFYRIQMNSGLIITPSVQLLMDPALGTAGKDVWLMGLRVRFTF